MDGDSLANLKDYLLRVKACFCKFGFRFNVLVYTKLVCACVDKIPLQCAACVDQDYPKKLKKKIHGKGNEGTSVDNAVFVLMPFWHIP